MPLVPSFTISQTALSAGVVIFTDTSSGSDVLVISRKITITDSAGNPVVQSGNTGTTITWALATNPYSLDLLTQDMAVQIRVDWLNAAGASIYNSEASYCLPQFNKVFLYYLIQLQSLTYPIIQDTNYWNNVAILWANLTGAINAVEIASDITASQACLDRCTFMANNQSKYF